MRIERSLAFLVNFSFLEAMGRRKSNPGIAVLTAGKLYWNWESKNSNKIKVDPLIRQLPYRPWSRNYASTKPSESSLSVQVPLKSPSWHPSLETLLTFSWSTTTADSRPLCPTFCHLFVKSTKNSNHFRRLSPSVHTFLCTSNAIKPSLNFNASSDHCTITPQHKSGITELASNNTDV